MTVYLERGYNLKEHPVVLKQYQIHFKGVLL